MELYILAKFVDLIHLCSSLLMFPQASSQRYYPTRLATSLTSEAANIRSAAAGLNTALSKANGTDGFVIIETNYRIYAYTGMCLRFYDKFNI